MKREEESLKVKKEGFFDKIVLAIKNLWHRKGNKEAEQEINYIETATSKQENEIEKMRKKYATANDEFTKVKLLQERYELGEIDLYSLSEDELQTLYSLYNAEVTELIKSFKHSIDKLNLIENKIAKNESKK